MKVLYQKAFDPVMLMMQSILIGSLLMILTVFIHSWGTTTLMRLFDRYQATIPRLFGRQSGFVVLCTTAVFLLILHVIQVLCWSVVYMKLAESPDILTKGDAVYFSMVTYTTLGYGDITLTGDWRLLSGIQSMNGILLFGWSTALLFMVVQKIWLSNENESLPKTDDIS